MRNGKGSTPRRVDTQRYSDNYDRIFRRGARTESNPMTDDLSIESANDNRAASLGRCVAFGHWYGQRFRGGPVLHWAGGREFRREITDTVAPGGGLPDIEDLEIPAMPGPGLHVFEGWVEFSDDGATFVGGWRELTHWETCTMRCGVNPLKDWAFA